MHGLEKIQEWQNQLLDLSKNNPLLNHHPKVKIIQPEISDLWQRVVCQEQCLTFDDQSGLQAESLDEAALSKVLRHLDKKAKTIQEEKGVQTLYLSFGALQWRLSECIYEAPLLLVPVRLVKSSSSDGFQLKKRPGDIQLNPALKELLAKDFELQLPELRMEEDICTYLERASQLAAKNHWRILPQCCLSVLSFQKMTMYHDLMKNDVKLQRHPLIRSLANGKRLHQPGVRMINHDLLDPEDIYQVLDADSSQQDAIAVSKQGISYVLIGPPGSGKSQTIVNIIAENLAMGKKILFVSQKAAALSVVYRRMQETELSDFCLLLPDANVSCSMIIQQLEHQLYLPQMTQKDDTLFYADLKRVQKTLNDYASALHTVIEPLHQSVYEVYGKLLSYMNIPDFIFSIRGVRSISYQALNEKTKLLKEYAKNSEKIRLAQMSFWRSAAITQLSNDLRQEINASLHTLDQLIESVSCFTEKTSLSFVPSCNGLHELQTLLTLAASSPLILEAWLTSDIYELKEKAFTLSRLQADYQKHHEALREIKDFPLPLNQSLSLSEISRLEEHIRDVLEALREQYDLPERPDLLYMQRLYDFTAGRLSELQRIIQEISEDFDMEIFNLDIPLMIGHFRNFSHSPMKWMAQDYRKDRQAIISLQKDFSKKLTDEKILQILTSVQKAGQIQKELGQCQETLSKAFGKLYEGEKTDVYALKKQLQDYFRYHEALNHLCQMKIYLMAVREQEDWLKENFGFMYRREKTDWSDVIHSLEWTESFKKALDDTPQNDEWVSHICTNPSVILDAQKQLDALTDIFSRLDPLMQRVINLFPEASEWLDIPVMEMFENTKQCLDPAGIEAWLEICQLKKACQNAGLETYLTLVEKEHLSSRLIVDTYLKRFYCLWLDEAFRQYPELMNFNGQKHESSIKTFRNLDQKQLLEARKKLKRELISDIKTHIYDKQQAYLENISHQRSKSCSLRALFSNIPDLLLVLKPCLMMPPSAVSQLLDANDFEFDLVIFDEASQINTEDALGAILRSRQVIIAGDPKQLPPTDFFCYQEGGERSHALLDDAAILPKLQLRWHYRSQYESLIHFSNQMIYHQSLQTFPSNQLCEPDTGVEYIYVKDGYYDRGGRKGNEAEARQVAALIFAHFQKHPERSLGVVAFGKVQQAAIEDELYRQRQQHPEYEDFFKEDVKEPFFIKNLENVQGDQRDTLILSIGYGKDQEGKLYLNFGPLNQTGGVYRLNVAITRAKINMKVVGSVTSEDIQSENPGMQMLSEFIAYASKPGTVPDNQPQFDSPFEASVYYFLKAHGYQPVTQAGSAGYRIDMAIPSKKKPGSYLLGIECDGASYHSSATARERDRLRQSILEKRGWHLYRIWSTEWYKYPQREGQKLLEAIEKRLNQEAENK